MINLDWFYSALKRSGIEFITGVPDTLLNDFCLGLDTVWQGNNHVLAANEGNAISLAAGYHLSTDTVPLVYMQNSGMGNCMNPLISLTSQSVYSIPMVLLIGWRGEPGSGDWPQHETQGKLSPILLDALDIPYRILNDGQEECIQSLEWAIAEAYRLNKPTALLVKKGVLAKKEKSGFDDSRQQYSLSREEAIKTIIESMPQDSIYIASTGRITRELHAIRKLMGDSHENDFLNVGAMGHTLSIASGVAVAQSDRPVICLDGDAAALMHMGSLPVVANLDLPNLIHIVLNNGANESVGGQESVAFSADLNSIAKAAGYQTIDSFVCDAKNIVQGLQILQREARPAFMEVRIKKGMRSDMPVLKADLQSLKDQFMKNNTGKL